MYVTRKLILPASTGQSKILPEGKYKDNFPVLLINSLCSSPINLNAVSHAFFSFLFLRRLFFPHLFLSCFFIFSKFQLFLSNFIYFLHLFLSCFLLFPTFPIQFYFLSPSVPILFSIFPNCSYPILFSFPICFYPVFYFPQLFLCMFFLFSPTVSILIYISPNRSYRLFFFNFHQLFQSCFLFYPTVLILISIFHDCGSSRPLIGPRVLMS